VLAVGWLEKPLEGQNTWERIYGTTLRSFACGWTRTGYGMDKVRRTAIERFSYFELHTLFAKLRHSITALFGRARDGKNEYPRFLFSHNVV